MQIQLIIYSTLKHRCSLCSLWSRETGIDGNSFAFDIRFEFVRMTVCLVNKERKHQTDLCMWQRQHVPYYFGESLIGAFRVGVGLGRLWSFVSDYWPQQVDRGRLQKAGMVECLPSHHRTEKGEECGVGWTSSIPPPNEEGSEDGRLANSSLADTWPRELSIDGAIWCTFIAWNMRDSGSKKTDLHVPWWQDPTRALSAQNHRGDAIVCPRFVSMIVVGCLSTARLLYQRSSQHLIPSIQSSFARSITPTLPSSPFPIPRILRLLVS